MPKLLKATDPITVKMLCVLIFGQPGIGKTTLGLTAESPLLLDFDGGAHRAGIRGNSIPIESWQDALDLLDPSKLDPELKEVLSVSKTIVIDTMGKLQDFLTDYIIKHDSKMQRAGGLTLQGYGALKEAFRQYLNRIRLMGKDIVIIAHEKEDKDGDNLIMRPDIMGGSLATVLKEVDLVGRYYNENNKRVLNFNPTDRSIGKNCASFDVLTNPNMSEIFAQTKSHITDTNAKQRLLLETIADFRTKIDACTDADSINALIDDMKAIENEAVKLQIKVYLTKKLKELNLTLNADTNLFEKIKDKSEETEKEIETETTEKLETQTAI